MIDDHPGVPLHMRVADTIRASIDSGELAPLVYLRAERDLAHDFAVGIDTLRRALDELEAEGRVIRKRGYRTQVAPDGPYELLKMVPSARVRTRMPTPQERDKLKIRRGVPIFVVEWGRPSERRHRIYPGDRYELTTE